MEDDLDAWRAGWGELAGLGVLGIAAEGTPTELAVALEACAAALVPGPLLGTALAALVLAGSDLADGLADGTRTAAVALDAAELKVGDGPVLSGTLRPVSGADLLLA